MSWWDSLCTHIWVFSVGRGLAIFIRTGLNQGFIYDMGKSDDINPGNFIQENFVSRLDKYAGNAIAQAILSHPHSDHVLGCADLKEGRLYPTLLTCPHDREYSEYDERLNWQRIKNPDGTDQLMDTYRGLFALNTQRTLPLMTIRFDSRREIPNLEYGVYYIMPPKCEELHESDDNKYANSTSIIFYMRHGVHSILIPGDMTPEGMTYILEEGDCVQKRFTKFSEDETSQHPEWHEKNADQPRLSELLRDHGLTVLVAPHHGLESGYSADLYDSIRGGKPDFAVISERIKKRENDGDTDKRYYGKQYAFGLEVELEDQKQDTYSISTKLGHHLLLEFPGTGSPKAYGDKDPYALLKKLEK